MDAARIDFDGRRPNGPVIRKGRRWSHKIRWTENGIPLDMSTGLTWLCQIRPEPGSGVLTATPTVTLSQSPGQSGTPVDDETTLALTAAVTDPLTPGEYEIELVETTNKDTWLEGAVVIVPQVADPP